MSEHATLEESEQAPEPGAEAPSGESISPARRRFLTRLSLILGAIGSFLIGVPSVAYLLGLRSPSKIWRDVGGVDEFEPGSTTLVKFQDPSPLPWSGVTSNNAAWLRREDHDNFIAYSIICTHLGCPVRWLPGANLFMCPCHGGVFYANGTVASGPPPHPLNHYPVRVAKGRVQILTSPLPIT